MSIRDSQYSDYSQDFLVEKPTIETFAKLGLKTADVFLEKFGENGRLCRDTVNEIVLGLGWTLHLLSRNYLLPTAKAHLRRGGRGEY
jgi:hypothetical protein